jgi:hypothetical protein
MPSAVCEDQQLHHTSKKTFLDTSLTPQFLIDVVSANQTTSFHEPAILTRVADVTPAQARIG